MNCELCTWNIVKGKMYEFSRKDGGSVARVCDDCHARVERAAAVYVDEPMCECGRVEEWVCEGAISVEGCTKREPT